MLFIALFKAPATENQPPQSSKLKEKQMDRASLSLPAKSRVKLTPMI